MSLLLSAVAAGSAAGCRSAIEMGESTDTRDDSGATALHYCGIYRQVECARVLLEEGADIHTEDSHRNQPLWSAVFSARGDYEVVQLLLEHGADPDYVNAHGRSPRMLAVQIGDEVLLGMMR